VANIEKFNNNRITIFLFATSYTVAIMGVLAGGGYWLDKLLGTTPFLFIVGLLVGYPITQVVLFKKSRQLAKKISKKK